MALPATPNQNPVLRRYPIKTSETWAEGAILSIDGNGDLLDEASADPTPFLGFAAHAVPFVPVDIYGGEALVYCAGPRSTFWMSASVAPAQAHEGQSYGLVLASGIAQVDISETTNVRVRVERADTLRGLLEVSVIAEHRQLEL